MRAEIRRVCKEFKLTTVYVTHDQKEALSVSDRMAILESGRILQVGTPREIYRRPARKIIANFIGETDFVAGTLLAASGGRATVGTAIGQFEGVLGDPGARPAAGAAVTISIRPECWRLGHEPAARNSVRGSIGESVYLGEIAQHDFITGGTTLKIFELNPRLVGQPARGELCASVDPEDVVVLVE
jgi:iron(III) transport system ATP-binding protein